MGSVKSTAKMTSSSLKLCEIGMFQDAFQHFDTDLDGAVNTMEVGMIMRSVGFNPSEADIQDMVMVVDKDGTGSIDFPEFLTMMSDKAGSENAEEEIREAFRVFDRNGKGFITRYELSLVMANMGG